MEKISSETEDYIDDILTEVSCHKGIITLNKPKSLNAFTFRMLKKLLTTLRKWEDEVTVVVVKSIDKKAFSAGGDIFEMTEDGLVDSRIGIEMVSHMYRIVYLVSQYKIPYIALTDGITLGGGVGLSWAGKYCISTEKSVFAMPETAIGFMPDVGISFLFSRLHSRLGLYLALTGHRLCGKDAVKVGFATHFIESKDIPALYSEILHSESGNIETLLEKYSHDMSSHTFSLMPHMSLIGKVFSAPTVEQIMDRLQSDGSEFSKLSLERLSKMSPIALKTVKVQMEKAATLNLKECLQMDFRIAKAAIQASCSQDFHEGARALKEKRPPQWNPAKLEDVTEDMVNKMFCSCQQEELFL